MLIYRLGALLGWFALVTTVMLQCLIVLLGETLLVTVSLRILSGIFVLSCVALLTSKVQPRDVRNLYGRPLRRRGLSALFILCSSPSLI